MRLHCTLLPLVLAVFAAGFASSARTDQILFREDFSKAEIGEFPDNLEWIPPQSLGYQHPLQEPFRDFHIIANRDYVRYLIDEVRKAEPDPAFTVAGNLLGMSYHPRWLEVARKVDYGNCEYHFKQEDPGAPSLVLFYKMADAAQLPVLLMPAAKNNLSWRRVEDPVFYSMMVAEAYAMGHVLHVPYNLFDGSDVGRFFGHFETHRPVYHFVDRIRRLLDGYEPMATAAYISPYPHPEVGSHEVPELIELCGREFERNALFQVFYAGEDMPEITDEQLSGFETIEVLGDIDRIPALLRETIDGHLKRVVDRSAAPPVIAVDATQKVRVLPRASIEQPGAPVVVHLLNHNWRQEAGNARGEVVTKVDPLENITLSLHERLFQGKPVRSVHAHSIHSDSREVAFDRCDDCVIIDLPPLGLWTVLEIDAGDQRANPMLNGRRGIRPRKVPHSDIPMMRLIHGRNPEYPDWLKAVLEAGVDPMAQYKVTRMSWEYRVPERGIDYYHERGMKYIGSVNGGTTRLNPKIRPWDWPGWARMTNGDPVPRRPEWTPPSFGGSQASPAFREHVMSGNIRWIRKGVDGLQWDNLGGSISNYLKGGDFNPYFLEAFKTWLGETYSDVELRAMGIEDLEVFDVCKSFRRAIERRQEASRKAIRVREAPAGYGGRALRMEQMDPKKKDPLYWLMTPELSSASGRVRVLAELRMDEGSEDGPLPLYIVGRNPVRTIAVTLFLYNESDQAQLRAGGRWHDIGPLAPRGEWNRVEILLDFDSRTAQCSVNGAPMNRPFGFRTTGDYRDSFRAGFLRRPNFPRIWCRRLEVKDLTD